MIFTRPPYLHPWRTLPRGSAHVPLLINQPWGPHPCLLLSVTPLRTRCQDLNLNRSRTRTKTSSASNPAPCSLTVHTAPPPKALRIKPPVQDDLTQCCQLLYATCQALTFHHLPCPHDVHTSVPLHLHPVLPPDQTACPALCPAVGEASTPKSGYGPPLLRALHSFQLTWSKNPKNSQL